MTKYRIMSGPCGSPWFYVFRNGLVVSKHTRSYRAQRSAEQLASTEARQTGMIATPILGNDGWGKSRIVGWDITGTI